MRSSSVANRWVRLALSAVLLLLVLSGCSSAAEEGSPSAESEGSATAQEAGAAVGDFDCEALGRHAAVIRSANGWVRQIDGPEAFDLIGEDLDEVDAAIEGLRPIQDIEGIFGTTRQGLDNLAADIQAIRDGRYGEYALDYNSPGISAVLGEEVCK